MFYDLIRGKEPLVTGAILAGIGMLILSFPGLTEGPEDYWTTFFPGIVVLGTGMGIVIAPLTATVMASVPDKNSGIASGV